MQKILVVMGGQSTEHDISLITGVQTINNLDKTKYTIFPVVIDKEGKWYYSLEFDSVEKIIKHFGTSKSKKFEVVQIGKTLFVKTKNRLKKLSNIDCAVLCCHGGLGENGALQGLFECCGVPYVSPNHTNSGIFMDKSLSKIIFKNMSIRSADFIVVSKDEYTKNEKDVLDKIKVEIGFPCIVKPCSGGSSIGIGIGSSKIKTKALIEDAFVYDSDIIIEKVVENLYELNVAVAKYDGEIKVSKIERPNSKNKLLSFDDKYIGGRKSGLNNMSREIPAKISSEMKEYIENTAKHIYKNFIKSGVVRIDYLVNEKTNEIFIGEVNTIPGSMSFYLWEISFGELLDKLIIQAKNDKDKGNKLKKSFSSCVLDKFSHGLKMSKL